MSSNYVDDDGTVTGINVTPMVDIMLVLLIVFMVTASFVTETGLKVTVPKVQESEDSTTISLAVSIDGKGQLFLKGTKVDVNNLRTSLGQQAIINPNVKVTLAADSKLPYQQVADTLSAIKQAGVSQVALITQK
jgi:biopolymer transport protein ExbD